MSDEVVLDEIKKIRATIKTALIKKDISQNTLAQMLNVDKTKISRAVNGDMSNRSVELRKSIYKILNIN